MSVTLNSTGITFSDGTSTSTNQLPSGTRLPFHQSAAPTGWTQDTGDVANNRMLRFVSSAGGNYGGSYDPTYNNVVPSHTHGFSTGNQSANHNHGDTGHAHSASTVAGSGGGYGGWDGGGWAQVGNATATAYAALGGNSANHYHAGTTDNGSSQTTWYPRFTDLIICSKN